MAYKSAKRRIATELWSSKYFGRPSKTYYEVDEIMDHLQGKNGEIFLKLRWTSHGYYTPEDDSWQPLVNCNNSLKEYYKNRPDSYLNASETSSDQDTDISNKK